MIILDKNATKLTLNKHFLKDCIKIKLINVLSNQTYTYIDLIDSSESNFFYILSPVDFSDLEQGTYKIELYDVDDNLIETQLGCCGEYALENKQYDKKIKRTIYERN